MTPDNANRGALNLACIIKNIDECIYPTEAYGWGYNYKGQVGNNDTTDVDSPELVLEIGGSKFTGVFKHITTGFYHTCGLLEDGTAYCWGDNGKGQLGTNSSPEQDSPALVENADGSDFSSKLKQISVGTYYSVCITE